MARTWKLKYNYFNKQKTIQIKKMKNIPTSFNLFGQLITVQFVDDLVNKNNALGLCHYMSNQIDLQSPNDEFCEQQIEQTFWHEYSHMLFWKAGFGKLANKEKLIDVLGSLLHQSIMDIHNNLNERETEDEEDDDEEVEEITDDELMDLMGN
jgi:hypothetical protein